MKVTPLTYIYYIVTCMKFGGLQDTDLKKKRVKADAAEVETSCLSLKATEEIKDVFLLAGAFYD